ncbi:FAD-binding oxidoreductase [Streptomyces sp. NPDC053474]|uniref:FAD-binding oxidoreductase n=1 Tax=Streptomyces sp. NPDC053474 TaxID=3365704 RepID=UPI0037CEC263
MPTRRALLGAGAGIALASSSTLLVGSPLAQARPRPPRGPRTNWGQLCAALQGDLILPSDSRYDRARQLASAQFDHLRPQAVAYCENATDVATCIRFAQDNDIHTAIRSGGHSFTGWSTTQGLVINLTRLNSVRTSGSTVHVGPATQMVDVVAQLATHGLAVPGGFCPTVCPGGFVSGGGHGWQHRKYGPASDRLVGAQVVLADGRIVTTSAKQNPDLLWALRGGGGGNFGVITDFELAPTQVPVATTFTLTWDWAKAQDMLVGYQQWARNAAPEVAPDAVLLLPDARPGAVPTAMVTGAYLGTAGPLKASLDQLVSLVGSAPASRVSQELPYDKAMMQRFGCATLTTAQCHTSGTAPGASLPRTAYTKNRGRMFARPLPAGGLNDLLSAFEAARSAGQTRVISLMALGGNANNVASDATAYVHRDAEFTSVCGIDLSTPQPTAAQEKAAQDWVDGCFAAIDPHSNGRAYVNYPDPKLADFAQAYYGTNLPRLTQVKRRYDPHGFFRFPQALTP